MRVGQSLWWELLAALIGPVFREAAGPASRLSLLWLLLHSLKEDSSFLVRPALQARFTLVLQMEKQKPLGRLGPCPRSQQGQARLPGVTTRKPRDTALFLTLLATETSSHRKEEPPWSPAAVRALPSARHRTLPLAFMCPCENITHPQRPYQTHKTSESVANRVDGRSPLWQSWVAKYCCDISALCLNVPFLENEKSFQTHDGKTRRVLVYGKHATCLLPFRPREILRSGKNLITGSSWSSSCGLNHL